LKEFEFLICIYLHSLNPEHVNTLGTEQSKKILHMYNSDLCSTVSLKLI